MLGHPDLNIDVSKLPPLLEKSVVNSLVNQLVFFTHFFVNVHLILIILVFVLHFNNVLLKIFFSYRYLYNVKRNYRDWMKNALSTDVKVIIH